MKPPEIDQFLKQEFQNYRSKVVKSENNCSTVIHKVTKEGLRPGDTVSGPTIMTLADTAIYAAILGLDEFHKMAVTSTLNFNFLRKANADKPLIAECELIKVGRKLITAEVKIYSANKLIASAIGTYVLS